MIVRSNYEEDKCIIFSYTCYNEELVLDITTEQLTTKLNTLISENKISKNSRILYVDDGSKDSTWDKILDANKVNKLICGVKLSRNMGHQNALLAGLVTANKYADITISMDADLQDDIDVIDKMIDEYKQWC